jgi:chemotaxis protein MotB
MENDSLQGELNEKDARIVELQRERDQQKAAYEMELAAVKSTHDRLVADLRKEISAGDIQVKQVRNQLQLTVAEQLFFETGEAEIKPQGQQVLRRIGGILKNIPEKNIRVEGHTDNVPIGPSLRATYPTNWELGSARAVNVVRYLQRDAGIEPLRLSAVSYGQYRPVASNRTQAGRSKNRRIEIILIDRDLDLARKMRQYL